MCLSIINIDNRWFDWRIIDAMRFPRRVKSKTALRIDSFAICNIAPVIRLCAAYRAPFRFWKMVIRRSTQFATTSIESVITLHRLFRMLTVNRFDKYARKIEKPVSPVSRSTWRFVDPIFLSRIRIRNIR